jgi:hypothetical protein
MMDADTIEKTVNQILIDKETLTKEDLDAKFIEFRTKQRMLYETGRYYT